MNWIKITFTDFGEAQSNKALAVLLGLTTKTIAHRRKTNKWKVIEVKELEKTGLIKNGK